jgi:DNA-binding transcriptional regulator YiaG
MTSAELIQIRHDFGFTQSEMANRLRTGLRQYQKWEYEDAGIRDIVALTVEMLVALKGTETGKAFGV